MSPLNMLIPKKQKFKEASILLSIPLSKTSEFYFEGNLQRE